MTALRTRSRLRRLRVRGVTGEAGPRAVRGDVGVGTGVGGTGAATMGLGFVEVVSGPENLEDSSSLSELSENPQPTGIMTESSSSSLS